MHRRHEVLHCSSWSTHTTMFTPVCSRLPNVQTCFILAMSLSIMLCHAQPYSFTQQNDMQLIQATCIAKQCSSKACHPSSSSIVSHCSAARGLLLALGFTGSWWDSTCLFALTRCAVSSLLGWTCTAASIIGEVVTTHKMHSGSALATANKTPAKSAQGTQPAKVVHQLRFACLYVLPS